MLGWGRVGNAGFSVFPGETEERMDREGLRREGL